MRAVLLAVTLLVWQGCSLDWGGLSAGDAGDGGTTDAMTDAPLDGPPPDTGVPTTCAVGEPGCPVFDWIALGEDHGCGIRDGDVLCWGWNDGGQLGVGNRDWVAMPREVTGLDPMGQVAAGDAFTCAVTQDGRVWCWGQNYAGQLGRPTSTGNNPGEVSGLTGVTAIDLGSDHVCALDGEGHVWCWGRNDHQQIGQPGTVNTSSSPNEIVDDSDAPLTGIEEIAVGERFSCARRDDGMVLCWGSNEASELGTGGPPASVHRATPVTLPDPATRIYAGARHACALSTSGLRCWGSTRQGQLLSTGELEYAVPRPLDVEDVRDVALGANHTCVLHSDGRVSCFGHNGAGELGRPIVNAAEPVPMEVSGLGATAILVAGGVDREGMTCAQSTEGALRCWGFSGYGALATEPPRVAEAAQVSGALAGQVWAGFGKTCSYDGIRAACVGWNDDGEMGDGSPETAHASGRTPLGLDSFFDVAFGDKHLCAISDTMALYCWGDNGDGQLGRSGGDVRTPTRVDDERWREIEAGLDHTCGIRESGEVLCWGAGDRGQIGHGSSAASVETPTPVAGLPSSNARELSLGEEHSCVIVDGDVYCWGRNSAGQLGLSGLTDRVTAERVTSTLWPSGSVEELAAGHTHTCAIADGDVYCWGDNSDGQTASGTGPTPRAVPSVVGAWEIAASEENTCVIDGSDEIVCWGEAADGRIGRALSGEQPPMTVPGIASADYLAMGASHVCASADGVVHCFGVGVAGQLGDERAVLQPVPRLATQVP